MTHSQFQNLCKSGKIMLPRTFEANSSDSLTDPTQAMPVKNIYECLVYGKPIDVKEHSNIYNGLHTNELSTLEKRGYDAFDVSRESKDLGKRFSRVAKLSDEE